MKIAKADHADVDIHGFTLGRTGPGKQVAKGERLKPGRRMVMRAVALRSRRMRDATESNLPCGVSSV